MKDLRSESLEEAREKYESAVKTFENTNSFAKTELFDTSFVETGQNFDRAKRIQRVYHCRAQVILGF